jgi:hypothetical protein
MDCIKQKPTEQQETSIGPRSIYWGAREPQRACHACGFPFGVHRGDCPSLVRDSEDER